jgi:hypothetical protein
LLKISAVLYGSWSFFCLDAKEPKSQGWKSNSYNLGHFKRARDPSRSARLWFEKQRTALWDLASLADRSSPIPHAILLGIVFQAGKFISQQG